MVTSEETRLRGGEGVKERFQNLQRGWRIGVRSLEILLLGY